MPSGAVLLFVYADSGLVQSDSATKTVERRQCKGNTVTVAGCKLSAALGRHWNASYRKIGVLAKLKSSMIKG